MQRPTWLCYQGAWSVWCSALMALLLPVCQSWAATPRSVPELSMWSGNCLPFLIIHACGCMSRCKSWEGGRVHRKIQIQYACFVGALSVLRIYAHPLCDNATVIQLFTLMCAWFYAFTSRHWQDLGYLIIYITGRPDMQKQRVVSWLSQHNFPHGMIFFSEGLVHDPLRQKTIFLRNLIQEVNPDISIGS